MKWVLVNCALLAAVNLSEATFHPGMERLPTSEKIRSPAMRAQMEAIKSAGGLPRNQAWRVCTDYPEWLASTECEFGHIPPNHLKSHDYRYEVYRGTDGQLLVIRTGGLAGMREMFTREVIVFRGMSLAKR